MDRKSLFLLALGVLCAAIICLVAGLIVFFVADGNAIMLLVGIVMIALGAFMAFVPLIILVWLIAIRLLNKRDNNG